jgi:small-conductance mechanosensitive channel
MGDLMDHILYKDVTILDVIIVLGIFLAAFLLERMVTLSLRRNLKDKVKAYQLDLLRKLISYTIILIAIAVGLPMLSIKLSGLLVAGGITGLILGFASQNIVSNLISGLFLIAERPIRIGQQVNIDGTVGFVDDIRILSTSIRTYDGLYIRVPNERVFTSNIINLTANIVRRFDYNIGIRYRDDADKAIKIIKNLLDDHPLVLKNPVSQVFVDTLGDNSVNLAARIWCPVTEWYGVRMELLWKIKTTLEAQGIQVPFPQRTVHFESDLAIKQGQEPDSPNQEPHSSNL